MSARPSSPWHHFGTGCNAASVQRHSTAQHRAAVAQVDTTWDPTGPRRGQVCSEKCLDGGIPTPLKNISQLGWLFPIYGEKNVPNHQWMICCFSCRCHVRFQETLVNFFAEMVPDLRGFFFPLKMLQTNIANLWYFLGKRKNSGFVCIRYYIKQPKRKEIHSCCMVFLTKKSSYYFFCGSHESIESKYPLDPSGNLT